MVKLKTLLPIVSGLCVLLYAYGWYADLEYPAYVPLVWCLFCFTNDLFTYLESKND